MADTGLTTTTKMSVAIASSTIGSFHSSFVDQLAASLAIRRRRLALVWPSLAFVLDANEGWEAGLHCFATAKVLNMLLVRQGVRRGAWGALPCDKHWLRMVVCRHAGSERHGVRQVGDVRPPCMGATRQRGGLHHGVTGVSTSSGQHLSIACQLFVLLYSMSLCSLYTVLHGWLRAYSANQPAVVPSIHACLVLR